LNEKEGRNLSEYRGKKKHGLGEWHNGSCNLQGSDRIERRRRSLTLEVTCPKKTQILVVLSAKVGVLNLEEKGEERNTERYADLLRRKRTEIIPENLP